jgi:hypothetical protein
MNTLSEALCLYGISAGTGYQRDPSGFEPSVFFNDRERKLVISALTEAEERTSRYYCIPPRHWQRLQYDLITGKDLGWEPLPETALARVQRVAQINARRRVPADFFRIQLNDPSILSAAKRENLVPDIYPFLVYIITHEMVHLVRLGTILDGAESPPSPAEVEEDRVERISRQILSRSGCEYFKPVFEKFRLPAIASFGSSS